MDMQAFVDDLGRFWRNRDPPHQSSAFRQGAPSLTVWSALVIRLLVGAALYQ